MRRITRRELLAGMVSGALGVAVAGCGASSGSGAAGGAAGSLRGGRRGLRAPGTRPFPSLPVGHDSIPQIRHVLVFMQENHSFDNVLGVLGRGDGLRLDAAGVPQNTNPGPNGERIRSFPMPTPCQLPHQPSQTWNASHLQYDKGTNQGFVTSPSGPVAMGYFTDRFLPFSYELARVFPVGDRYFCSLLGQTFPNRRYLLVGTSQGSPSWTRTSPAPQRRTPRTCTSGTSCSPRSSTPCSTARRGRPHPTRPAHPSAQHPRAGLRHHRTRHHPPTQRRHPHLTRKLTPPRRPPSADDQR
jgi:phospholipase C